MTRFVDLRRWARGGFLVDMEGIRFFDADQSKPKQHKNVKLDQFVSDLRGKDVIFVVHGFNVDCKDGIEHLDNWATILGPQLPPTFAVLGILWPGDSIWLHGLDYPEEPRIANEAGTLLAAFFDQHLRGAASISLVSHSLGARVLLATVSDLPMPSMVAKVLLMAGAIDNDCLVDEFRDVPAKIGSISVLSSMQDTVLSLAFPLGNPLSGILAEGHPWCKSALGHCGPSLDSIPLVRRPYAIQDPWNFKHGDYLNTSGGKSAPVPAAALALPDLAPTTVFGDPLPGAWHEGFTAAFAAQRLP